MATQPIAPSNIQARTERLKSRTLFITPKKITDPRIKLHRCFNQIAGQEKPNSCSCKDRITFSEASAMIVRGEADWLLIRNPKINALVKFQRAIVARPSKSEIKEQSTQLQTYRKNETGILERFRKFALSEFSKGNIPQAVVKVSDAELRVYLASPEQLRELFPEFGIKRLWKRLTDFSSDFWINHADAIKISEDTGKYMKLAPQGRGKVVTGGYDLAKLEQVAAYDVDAASESGNQRELGSLFRVRPEGYGPDQFENEHDAE